MMNKASVNANVKMKPQFIAAVLLIYFTSISHTAADDDNLRLVLDKLDKVKDAAHIFDTDVTFDKVDGEEVKINGQIVQAIDLDDEYKLNVDLLHSAEKDGEYKKVIGIANVGVCQFMANQYKKYFYEKLKNYANAADPDKCPVSQETYVIKDYPVDSSKYQKFLRPGFFKTTISLMHNEEEVLHYIIESHTE